MQVILPFKANDLGQFRHNCLATDCSYEGDVNKARIEHAVIGMITELPEFANAHRRLVKILDLIEDHGGSPDSIPWFENCVVNFLEEFGDIQWYGALFERGCTGLTWLHHTGPEILCAGDEIDAPVCGTADEARAKFETSYEDLMDDSGLDILKKLKFYDRWDIHSNKGSGRFKELVLAMHGLQLAAFSALSCVMRAFQVHHSSKLPSAHWLRVTQNWAHKARLMVSYKLITSRYKGAFTQESANLRDVANEQELMLRILRDTSL